MEIKKGYSYHIKDEFFDLVQDKYKVIMEKKVKRYGKCNTIVIGKFAGRDNAFLIQNAFPVIKKYFDHVHMIENKPILIHSKLNRELTVNLREVLAMYRHGIHLIFPDIDYIQRKMEDELGRKDN